ncbi:MAG: methylated-DNA--[protein]-cysteine S-methyltransferase [Deltaproteobacteria bacterium]|nr:methylated-DNA--[protein]-cysteine S-methyltransferase [Deltaproteobacteria bacterium]
MVSVTSLETAFGTLWLAASERGLCRLALPPAKEHARFHAWVTRHGPPGQQGSAVLALANKELQEYLAGARRHFTVPLDVEGSEFFRQVWDVLMHIPYGQTLTYTALAARAQRPRAFRAAGAACALNPVPLIIPCHRAVGSNGSLTGFGGGLAMKEALLRMEGAIGGKGTD